ncbi:MULTISPECIES: DUF3951 domain-containing protein [Bacillaceae]|uniref:DUF3951 domain-containing protein n=1 Tax=Bacillaceae TaxID=186817 RepID=UPI0032EFECA9
MILLYITLLLIGALTVVPIVIVVGKTLIIRKFPNNYYTPFDYISAQTTEEFHEEKEEIAEENKDGDSK